MKHIDKKVTFGDFLKFSEEKNRENKGARRVEWNKAETKRAENEKKSVTATPIPALRSPKLCF